MVIIVDAGIPHITEYLEPYGAVSSVAGHEIRSSHLKDANVLVVRTVTRVDRELLEGTPVRLVASATAGVDHIDVEGLEAGGISVAHAPGCNAPAVCDYVLTAIFELAATSDFDPFSATFGIVGVGNVGGRLNERLRSLGIRTLLNDPPKVESARDELMASDEYVELPELLAASDILSLHVPLTRSGAHPTLDLVGAKELKNMRETAWLLNSARGGVVTENALKGVISDGRIRTVIDVWSGEPTPDCELVTGVSIATPHIAGYGIESKDRAALAVAEAVASFAGQPAPSTNLIGSSRQLPIVSPGPAASDVEFCAALTRQAYDIRRDHLHMQGMCSFAPDKRSEYFLELRNGYRLRNEFSSHVLDRRQLTNRQEQLALALGLGLKD